jgi:hypothetical protein
MSDNCFTMLADSEYRDPWYRYRQVSGELITPECRSSFTMTNSNTDATVTNPTKIIDIVVWPTREPTEGGVSIKWLLEYVAPTPLEFMPNETFTLLMTEMNEMGFTWEPVPVPEDNTFKCVDMIVDPAYVPFVTGYHELMF